MPDGGGNVTRINLLLPDISVSEFEKLVRQIKRTFVLLTNGILKLVENEAYDKLRECYTLRMAGADSYTTMVLTQQPLKKINYYLALAGEVIMSSQADTHPSRFFNLPPMSSEDILQSLDWLDAQVEDLTEKIYHKKKSRQLSLNSDEKKIIWYKLRSFSTNQILNEVALATEDSTDIKLQSSNALRKIEHLLKKLGYISEESTIDTNCLKAILYHQIRLKEATQAIMTANNGKLSYPNSKATV